MAGSKSVVYRLKPNWRLPDEGWIVAFGGVFRWGLPCWGNPASGEGTSERPAMHLTKRHAHGLAREMGGGFLFPINAADGAASCTEITSPETRDGMPPRVNLR